jgi:hypothetical protein
MTFIIIKHKLVCRLICQLNVRLQILSVCYDYALRLKKQVFILMFFLVQNTHKTEMIL